MNKIDMIFVLNLASLAERLGNISSFLSGHGERFRVIQEEPPEEWVSKLPQDKEEWDRKISFIDYCEPVPRPHRSLSKEELSIAWKQLRALEIIVEEDMDRALILEDDVLFRGNFFDLFEDFSKENVDYDALFIGSGCNLRIDSSFIISNKHLYLKSHPAAKCADSYVITNAAAKKILSTLHPLSLPWDIELCYQMKKHDMKVYWMEPPITAQGSQMRIGGEYSSAIQIHEI